MRPCQWVLGLVAFVLTAATVWAEEPAAVRPPKSYVLVIGAGDFKDKAIQPRPSADTDAKALYDLLTDPKYFDVAPGRAQLLLSYPDEKRKAEVATHDAVIRALNTAMAETKKDDLLIVAFFGRGASVGDKTCFLTPETVFKDRAKTAVVGSDLEPAFKKLKGQHFLLLMDVAYKGFDPGEEKVAEPTLRDIISSVFGGDDKEDNALPPDRLIVLGNPPFQEPLAKGGQSVFSFTLLNALRGAADSKTYNEGYEPDGYVTTEELTKYLEKEIPAEARVLGKTDKLKELNPVFIGDQTSSFRITKNPAAIEVVEKRIKLLADLAKDGKVTPDIGKEGAALLGRMPKLKSAQELRKDYQKLVDGELTVVDFMIARKTLKDSLQLDQKAAADYARKVEEAIELVTEVYIRLMDKGDLTAAAIRGMYRRIREPLPTDLEEALKTPKELSDERRAELLEDARRRLGKREDLADDKDVDLSILMMLFSLNDPYTSYTDRENKRRNDSALRGRFSGVGIQIRRDAVRDGLLVVTPIKGSPAFKAGIQAGDLITEIRRTVDPEGKPLKSDDPRTFTTKGMKTEDAIKIILGNPDTPITLVVDREGEKEPMVFDLKRGIVSVETVLGVSRKENTDWQFFLDPRYKIGYIHLNQFTRNTGTDMKKAIAEMRRNGGMNGLILDLRNNPGGFLTTAIEVCEAFVGREKIVTVKPRVGQQRKYSGMTAVDKDFPLVVLVNGNSASASEIVSACLQDHNRAVILGEKSFGKGSVQDVLDFKPTGGEIKLTIARYYPPSDRNIDKLAADNDPKITEWGVTPDTGFEVTLPREERNELSEHLRNLEIIPVRGKKPKEVEKPFKDRQLDKALEYLRDQIKAAGKAPPAKDGNDG